VSLRIQQVNELIKRELGKIIFRELDIPRNIILTVTRVNTTNDLRETSIFVSIIPRNKEKEILKMLNREIYTLQQILNKRLFMKPVPKIRFLLDKETEKAVKIEEILKEINKKEEK